MQTARSRGAGSRNDCAIRAVEAVDDAAWGRVTGASPPATGNIDCIALEERERWGFLFVFAVEEAVVVLVLLLLLFCRDGDKDDGASAAAAASRQHRSRRRRAGAAPGLDARAYRSEEVEAWG